MADLPAVQRFIGLVKYLFKFLQHLSELCEPLHRLTHKKAEWNWTHEQEDAIMCMFGRSSFGQITND